LELAEGGSKRFVARLKDLRAYRFGRTAGMDDKLGIVFKPKEIRRNQSGNLALVVYPGS